MSCLNIRLRCFICYPCSTQKARFFFLYLCPLIHSKPQNHSDTTPFTVLILVCYILCMVTNVRRKAILAKDAAGEHLDYGLLCTYYNVHVEGKLFVN